MKTQKVDPFGQTKMAKKVTHLGYDLFTFILNKYL